MAENGNSTKFKRIIAISIIINIVLSSTMAIIYLQTTILAEQNNNLTKQLQLGQNQYEVINGQLEFYKKQAEYYSALLTAGGTAKGIVGQAKMNVVAVRELITDTYEPKYQGVTMTAEIELRSGAGRTLINTQPKIGIDLQASAQTAKIIAQNITGVPFDKTDLILTVKADEEVEVVDGPSAGAAITLAIVAATLNRTIKQSAYITGTINPDGTIGKVGGVLEKAVAAAEKGATLFVVPEGEANIVISKPEENHPFPGLTIIVYKQYTINLEQYLTQQGYNVQVLQIKTIQEAYKLFITP